MSGKTLFLPLERTKCDQSLGAYGHMKINVKKDLIICIILYFIYKAEIFLY